MSVEAADIYKQEQETGVAVWYKLSEVKSDACFRPFKVLLDDSLDSMELEKAYKRICRKKFSFSDKFGNAYTLAVINVKFNYIYKPENGKPVNLKSLREHFYENGFNLDGIHYVRYKRSAGSSREGKCLFIDERLQRAMNKWSECGLKPQKDLASWESYKALSLSSIKGTVKIPLDGILFVPDYKSVFQEEVVSVEIEDGKLSAKTKQTQITNDIWDGESLLDESIFQKYYADKHMLLLRGKFFKSCAFRTKLQKWFADKHITLESLKARGFITLAEDINQIVMVTTPNSLKYLKFAGGLTEKNIRQWAAHTDGTFGVVKYDKSTRFFHGKMVQSSYQLLNTLSLSEQEVKQLLQPSIDYISLLRRDVDFMRYHFTDAFAREKEGEEERLDGIAERADVIFTLMHKYPHFDETELYANFRDDVVTDIPENAFAGCTKLKTVTIGENVSAVEQFAFSGCSSLSEIQYAGTMEQLFGITFGESWNPGGEYNAQNYTLTVDGEEVESRLEVPDSVTELHLDAFIGVKTITELVLPVGITKVWSGLNAENVDVYYAGSEAQWLNIEFAAPIAKSFALYCQGDLVEAIDVPSELTVISDYAFSGCNSLKSISFSERSQLQIIGKSAFENCINLSTALIPIGVGQLTEIGNNAFKSCSALTGFQIPASVSVLGDSAFEGCTALKTVDFGTGSLLTVIPNRAFNLCSSLTAIRIPFGVTRIGENAFYGATALKEVTFEGTEGANALTTIDKYAFTNCSKLASFIVSKNMQTFGTQAFKGCTSLVSVYNYSSLPLVQGSSAYGCVAFFATEVIAKTVGE